MKAKETYLSRDFRETAAQRFPAQAKQMNLLLFTVVFSVLGLALKSVLGLNNYLSAFWYFLAFGEGLGLFDLLVIDLLWWRSTKRIRFSFLPEKKYYQDPKKHIESFLHGMPLFAAIAALTALIVTVL